MGKKEEPSDKGVFIWGFFTAIMIIVVVAAVLVFVFKIDLSGKNEVNNKAVINESMIDKGIIVNNDGTTTVLNHVEFEIKDSGNVSTDDETTTTEDTTNTDMI